jgi:hypothetical protein
MTAQELINLIVHLPPGCPLDRAQRGEAADWKVAEHLLAHLFNLTLQANSSKQIPESKLIRPPGTEGRRRPKARAGGHKQLGAAELDALFTGGG